MEYEVDPNSRRMLCSTSLLNARDAMDGKGKANDTLASNEALDEAFVRKPPDVKAGQLH